MGKAAAVSDSRPWVKYLILLYAVLFLSAINGCYSYCTAADKQQSNPQGKIAVVTGLRRSSCIVTRFIVATVVITWQLRRYDLSLGDFLCCFGVLVILLATGAVPILDIALGSLGRRHCREVFQIRVVVCIEIAVLLTANLTGCLLRAGCCSAGMFVLNGYGLFGRKGKAVSGLCTYDQLEAGFFCRICGCLYDTAVQTILNGRRKRTIAKSDKLIPIDCIRRSFRQGEAELVILCPANLICTTDVNGRNILFCSFVIAEFTLLPILPVFALPLVGVSVIYGNGNPCFIVVTPKS